ncbi:MAG: hypothetical protein ACI9BW_002682 [Gammaproteobacteria bacterium]|jgi:hypothetical protein
MSQPTSYQAVAFNEVPNSENQIHGDDVAARFGFEGGLVPGVTVSAYLAHPAVLAWGPEYVSSGAARLVVEKPVYDGYPFSVEVSADGENAYNAVLSDQSGSIRARGRCWMPAELPVAPQRRGDPILSPDLQRPPDTPETMRSLQSSGLGALQICWDDAAELTTYFRDPTLMPTPLNLAGGRNAHLGFVLGLTNWALGRNAHINPWMRLQTESQCFRAVEYGTGLVVESAIVDLFEKKGHHFCDVDVDAFQISDDAPVMHARLRAIYQLRGA